MLRHRTRYRLTCTCGCVWIESHLQGDPIDRHKMTRILERGKVWDDELSRLLIAQPYKVTSVAKRLGVTRATLYRHIRRLGLGEVTSVSSRNEDRADEQSQQSEFLLFRQQYPAATRSNLRAANPRLYHWFMAQNPVWRDHALPRLHAMARRKSSPSTKFATSRKTHISVSDPPMNSAGVLASDAEFALAIRTTAQRLIAEGRSFPISWRVLRSYIPDLPRCRINLRQDSLAAVAANEVIETAEQATVRRISSSVQRLRRERRCITRTQLILQVSAVRHRACPIVVEALNAALIELEIDDQI